MSESVEGALLSTDDGSPLPLRYNYEDRKRQGEEAETLSEFGFWSMCGECSEQQWRELEDSCGCACGHGTIGIEAKGSNATESFTYVEGMQLAEYTKNESGRERDMIELAHGIGSQQQQQKQQQQQQRSAFRDSCCLWLELLAREGLQGNDQPARR